MKKKEKVGVVPKKTLSRAKFNCPPRLAEFIEMINVIPPNTELPNFVKVYNEIPGGLSVDQHLELVFEKCYAAFSEEYKEKLKEDFVSKELKKRPNDISFIVRFEGFLHLFNKHYELFKQLFDGLKQIAHYFSYLRKPPAEDNDTFRTNQAFGNLLELPKFSIQLKRDGKKGKFSNDLPDAFNNVDLDRIRSCAICDRIFWAKREDSKTCSPGCRNVLNVRKSRLLTEEEKAKKNTQRKLNKDRNKKLKQLKESKNGTL